VNPRTLTCGLACALLGLYDASPAAAQIEFTPLLGVHLDHPPRSEYAIIYQYTHNLPFGDTWEISQPSTIPTYGGRLALAVHPSFRFLVEALFSKNSNSVNYILNSEPPPGTVPVDSAFEIKYRYVSLRMAWDPLVKTPITLRVSFGLSWLRRSGTGQLLIPSRSSNGFGGAATGLVRLAPHLNLRLDASLLAFHTGQSLIASRSPPGSDGSTRHDVHLLVGLNWVLGHPLAQGHPSQGPSLAPRTP
jgi:hypothetical protein